MHAKGRPFISRRVSVRHSDAAAFSNTIRDGWELLDSCKNVDVSYLTTMVLNHVTAFTFLCHLKLLFSMYIGINFESDVCFQVVRTV